MRFHCLQHVASEPPGMIADWITAAGHTLALTRLHENDPLPDPDAFDVLVLMGGPMNIYQYRDHPWLKPERELIAWAIAAGRKTLGVCLGSQLIADALGARVAQNSAVEIGWFPVCFTPEARIRFPGLPGSLDVLHWHGDTFELPAGATRLAASSACGEQGFFYGENVLALQFHLEVTDTMACEWAEQYRQNLKPAAWMQDADAIVAQAPQKVPATRGVLNTLLGEFFKA